MATNAVAVLIVHGGARPAGGSWLELCLRKIREHTAVGGYRLYVWSARKDDDSVRTLVESDPTATLVEADADEHLAHLHAVPLQRLYERARSDGARVVVTLDDDAHPVKAGWLETLVQPLDRGAALCGVWRDELDAAIEPYVHPSALATTVAFLESHNLRLETVKPGGDTLSHLTAEATAAGLPLERLRRSNRNALHRIIAGVYGDVVYHHAAGSRPRAAFWDDPDDAVIALGNRRARDLARRLLFEHYDAFMDWLRGVPHQGPEGGTLMLGMHRSGTSCLAGALERSGLWLGAVSRKNRHQPAGNHELSEVRRLNESILERQGGSWRRPPIRVDVDDVERAKIHAAVAALETREPWGMKDPRLLLLADHWLAAAPKASLVGIFRHPLAVAWSLERRDAMARGEALALWVRYNSLLLDRHRQRPFPLVEFTPEDPSWLRLQLVAAAIMLGLQPDLAALDAFLDLPDSQPAPDGPLPRDCDELLAALREGAIGAGIGEETAPPVARAPRRRSGIRNCIVLGCGRSGTSMIAGSLAQSGYFMGAAPSGPRPTNPKGQFEDREVNLVNEAILAAVVPSPPPLLGWAFPDRPRHMQRWLARVPVEQAVTLPADLQTRIERLVERRPYCFKDPRFCYTLPAWRAHLGDAVFVCVFRDPRQTVRSIRQQLKVAAHLRGLALTTDEAVEVWTLMYRHVLTRHRLQGEWLFLHVDQVVAGDGLDRLAAFTGAQPDRRFPEAALQGAAPALELGPEVWAVYSELCGLAGYTPRPGLDA